MSANLSTRVAAVDAATLLPLVERAHGMAVRNVIDWQFEPIQGGLSSGVWRFKGRADLQTGQAAWSMILKVPGELAYVGDPWGGMREPEVYRSGFRSPVPDEFTLPLCYGVVDQPVGRPWLWLEDVQHDASRTWTQSRYADVARRLGQFNGAFLVGHPLPAWPWLGNNGYLREVLQMLLPAPEIVRETASYWRQQGPHAHHVIDRLVDVYARCESLLAVVDRLPLTLSHGDSFQRNLLVRATRDVSLQVVAIDWSHTGLSVPGADAGRLISIGTLFSHIAPHQMQTLDRVVFPAYVQGLHEVGWQGDERLIRLGYTAATALWDGLVSAAGVVAGIPQEEERPWMLATFGWPPDRAEEYVLAMLQYHLDLADEALQLAVALNMLEA